MKTMKRFASLLVVLVLVCTVFATAAFASDATVNVSWDVISDGTQLKATVNLPGDVGFAGASVALTYNSTDLVVASAEKGLATNLNTKTAGVVRGNFFGTDEIFGGVLYTIVFDIKGTIDSGDYGVDTAKCSLSDATGNRMTADFVSGALNCSHKLGEWTVESEATCKVDGKKSATCSVCGETKSETIPATGKHDMVKGETVAPTCTSKGYTVYTCSGCGTTENRDETAMIAHDYTVKHITVAGDCDTPAKYEMDCSVCGAHEGKEYTDDAPGHAWGDYAVTKEATCTDKGEETATCSVCGEKDTKEIAAKGHSFGEYTVTKAPTCTEKGEETATCANGCGTTDTNEIAALGHDYVEVNHQDPTCTAEGFIEYECARSGCDVGEGKPATTADILPALGHEGGTATCLEKAVCEVCGNSYGELADHKYGDWKVTVEATKTEKGEMVRVCQVEGCGHEDVKTIPAKDTVAPKTGDEANIALYAVMFVMAGAAVVALSTKKKEN